MDSAGFRELWWRQGHFRHGGIVCGRGLGWHGDWQGLLWSGVVAVMTRQSGSHFAVVVVVLMVVWYTGSSEVLKVVKGLGQMLGQLNQISELKGSDRKEERRT